MLGAVWDVDDVGSLHAARAYLSGRGGPPARISNRYRILRAKTGLCGPGTATANIGNAVANRESRICAAPVRILRLYPPHAIVMYYDHL